MWLQEKFDSVGKLKPLEQQHARRYSSAKKPGLPQRLTKKPHLCISLSETNFSNLIALKKSVGSFAVPENQNP